MTLESYLANELDLFEIQREAVMDAVIKLTGAKGMSRVKDDLVDVTYRRLFDMQWDEEPPAPLDLSLDYRIFSLPEWTGRTGDAIGPILTVPMRYLKGGS